MKLVRFGPPGAERPGVLVGEHILDVRTKAFDIEDYNAHFFTHHGLDRLRRLLDERRLEWVQARSVRLGPPVARPGKIIALGKNYADHAREFDAEIPDVPILFSKASTAVIGPCDPVVLPPGATRVDGEVELAVIIGAVARHVAEAQALDYVAGYTVLNDVTDRDAQKTDRQWFRAKSYDTFCPLGPWLVTRDEIPDPQNLRLYLKVNGRILQDSNTSHMLFPIRRLIAFISAILTLEPGDVIATGTPGGIGSAHQPPVLLKPGATLEAAVDGLGAQVNPVVAS